MEKRNEYYSYGKETDKNNKNSEYIPPKITKKEEKYTPITTYDETPKNYKKISQDETFKLVKLCTNRDEKLLKLDFAEKKLEILDEEIATTKNSPFLLFKEIKVWSKENQRNKILTEIEQLKKDVKKTSNEINKIIN